jgi:hypothetical protein
MFCPIESVEMKVEVCPARSCMYRGIGGRCFYTELTDESVTVIEISDIKGEKLYKTKSAAASGKQAITIGVTIGQYAEFVRASFPNTQRDQTVNGKQDTHVSRVLENTFNLHPHQHQYFWDGERFEAWRTRFGLSLTLQDVRQALLGASSL